MAWSNDDDFKVTEIAENPLKHHLEPNNNPAQMYEVITHKLCKENSQLGNQFMSNLRKLQICMNCGHRISEEQSVSLFRLSNEKEEFNKSLSVTLKILYIFEGE